MTSALTILDCTLRDGGFHCDWDYAPELVHAYLRAVDAAGIDVAEVGYRSIANSAFAGAFKYTDETLVETLPPLSHTRLAVMLDARELEGHEGRIDDLFRPADASRVAIVRVATRVASLPSALEQIRRLKALGYATGLNIMAWASLPEAERPAIVDRLLASPADVIYIADSFGSMFPSDIRAFSELLAARQAATGPARPWGVHLHNNLELAFANALAALEGGASWVDASILGMGRGPGNLKSELLLQHLERALPGSGYEAAPLYTLIGRHWQALHERHRWGPRTPYVLSGFLAVHPSYAQELLESGRYTADEVVAILRRLDETGTGRSFSHDRLLTALGARSQPTEVQAPRSIEAWRGGDWSQREVLVIGRGPSAFSHTEAINRLIAERDPLVIECNHNPAIATAADHLVAFVVRGNATAMAEAALGAKKAVLLAFDDPALSRADAGGAVYQGAHVVTAGACDPQAGIAPADVVSMFAINTAIARGATRIHVVGFDGYPADAPPRERRMQAEMEEYLALLGEAAPGVALLSLTPTLFPLRAASIYGLLQGIEPT